jgi:glycine/D-amino acid oxidase-like deaminating enzyme
MWRQLVASRLIKPDAKYGKRLPKLIGPSAGSAPSVGKYFSTNIDLPSEANVVIIGGGIIGNSIAYHLAKMGMSDVCLLEQSQITAGTTWHAAGLMVTFGSLSETSTDIRKYTKALYSSLEAETGHSTGFKPCGFIELATETDKVEEYRRIAAFNRLCGVDVEEISPDEVKRLFPLCKTDDVYSGFYVKTDGRVNPVDACVALNKGAKMHGAKVYEGVRVSGVISVPDASRMNRVVTGVKTASGQIIKAKHVVNCAGMWARQLGEIDGVNIPNQAAEHYYLITDAIPGIDSNWPVVEDPASYTYIRPEGAGLMVGLFEGKAKSWNVNSIPTDFSFGEIEPDWERYGSAER